MNYELVDLQIKDINVQNALFTTDIQYYLYYYSDNVCNAIIHTKYYYSFSDCHAMLKHILENFSLLTLLHYYSFLCPCACAILALYTHF